MPHPSLPTATANTTAVSAKITILLLCLSTLRGSAGLGNAAFLPATTTISCRHHTSHSDYYCTLASKHNSGSAATQQTLPTSYRSSRSSMTIHAAYSNAVSQQQQQLSLSDFLLERKRRPTKNLVIGNEAGDADSIVSAIALAYVDSVILMMHDSNNDDDVDSKKRAKTPVVSTSKADLETQRPETVLLLQLAGVSTDALLFVDDPWILLEQQQQQQASTFAMTLVDHNRLSDKFSSGRHTVVEIVDHHSDEGLYMDNNSNDGNNNSACCVRNIAFSNAEALVASTCTLVVERLQENKVRGGDHSFHYPAQLSLLLLGVILLDSVNMAPAAGKATPRDAAALKALLDHTNWREESLLGDKAAQVLKLGDSSADKPDTTALFDALQNAKFAPAFWKSLAVRDALRLDYKSFAYGGSSTATCPSSFGVSTVLMPLIDFQTKDSVTDSIRAYMIEMHADLLVIMLAYTDNETGGLHRELLLAATDNFPVNEMAQFLQTHDGNSLQLTDVLGTATKESGLAIRCFSQGNAKASRKQVAPILLQFFENKA